MLKHGGEQLPLPGRVGSRNLALTGASEATSQVGLWKMSSVGSHQARSLSWGFGWL